MHRVKHLLVILVLFFASVSYTSYAQDLNPVHHQASLIRASYYADTFENREMANGRLYHAGVVSAASRNFRLGSMVRVTSALTGRSIVVEITDTGPWVDKFNMDLSKAAFLALGLDLRDGWGWVVVVQVK